MSQTAATKDNLDPEAGFTNTPSVSDAANDLRNAAGEKARELVHSAESKAEQFKGRAIESAKQFRDTAQNKATELKTVASEKATHFKESATEQWNDTRVKAQEMHVSAEDYIREHPTKCVLGAMGVGVLIGLIIRR